MALGIEICFPKLGSTNLGGKMSYTNDLRRGKHCVFLLYVHLVFVTKYRKHVFSQRHLACMERVCKKVCEALSVQLVEFNGERDHVHLLLNYPPKVPISKLVNSLKGVSSRLLKRDYPDIKKHYYKGVLWSPSYFAGSCGGASIAVVRKYIENQNRPS